MATTSRFKSWGSGTKHTSSRRSTRGSSKTAVPGYGAIWNSLNCKIASYKTLCAQTTGPAKFHRPSASTLNSFAKWVEKGAVIHKVSAAQVKRWANTTQPLKSAASAKTALMRKFGKSTIKAVTCDKSGAFLVACSATWKGGKTFNFPR